MATTLTLYHVSWCPECAVVRNKLAELKAPHEAVVVPDAQPMRTQVYEVSGQHYVPVLTDGDTVLTETKDILAYLEERYGKDGARREAGGDRRQGNTTKTPNRDAPGQDEDSPSCRR